MKFIKQALKAVASWFITQYQNADAPSVEAAQELTTFSNLSE